LVVGAGVWDRSGSTVFAVPVDDRRYHYLQSLEQIAGH
jgi:hypothetical protein